MTPENFTRLRSALVAIVNELNPDPAVFAAKIEAECERHRAADARAWVDDDLVKVRSRDDRPLDPATACFQFQRGRWAFLGRGEPPLAVLADPRGVGDQDLVVAALCSAVTGT